VLRGLLSLLALLRLAYLEITHAWNCAWVRRGAKSKSRESARRCCPYLGRPQALCRRPRSSKEVGAPGGRSPLAGDLHAAAHTEGWLTSVVWQLWARFWTHDFEQSAPNLFVIAFLHYADLYAVGIFTVYTRVRDLTRYVRTHAGPRSTRPRLFRAEPRRGTCHYHW
jgi:hypothetical protein